MAKERTRYSVTCDGAKGQKMIHHTNSIFNAYHNAAVWCHERPYGDQTHVSILDGSDLSWMDWMVGGELVEVKTWA